MFGGGFDVIFLDEVPTLDMRDLNRTRRFITLIDALYEANVIVVIRAAAEPSRLVRGGQECCRG